MKGFKMSIKGRLLLLVASLTALIVILGAVGSQLVSYIDKEYQRIYDEDAYATTVAVLASRDSARANAEAMKQVGSQDQTVRQQAAQMVAMCDQSMDKEMAILKERTVSPTAKQMMADIERDVAACRTARQAMLQAANRNGLSTEAAVSAMPETRAFHQAEEKLNKSLDAMIDFAGAAAGKEIEVLGGEVSRFFLISGIIATLLVVVVVVLSLRQLRSIVWRLNKLAEEAEAITAGDLVTPILILADDEIGRVATSFETMRVQMHDALSEVHMAAEQVAGGAKNVSDASVSLSQGAAEQAASVQQLSASIAEIASQTKSNADNAERANGLTHEACEQAAVGDTDMQEMLEAMEAINQSSESISKIIKVIDEIAFQTNILALNAAVEAARAGQHGKGFAVVAEEVRGLAARSAKAAKETTDMIEDSIRKVEGGRAIAGKTADALQAIHGRVNAVTELVAGIAKASQEQRLALEQINQGVLQVSQVVQGNSATSQQAAAASEELSAQADRMRETASRFRLQQAGTWQQVTSRQRPSVQLAPQPPKTLAGGQSVALQPPASTGAQNTDFGKY